MKKKNDVAAPKGGVPIPGYLLGWDGLIGDYVIELPDGCYQCNPVDLKTGMVYVGVVKLKREEVAGIFTDLAYVQSEAPQLRASTCILKGITPPEGMVNRKEKK